MGIHGGDGRTRRDHPGFAYTSQNELLYPIFRKTATLRDCVMHMTKCLVHNASQCSCGKLMRFELGFCPACFKCLNQVSRTDYLNVVTSDQLERAGIHTRHVRNGIEWGILHGHAETAGEQ